MIRKILIIYILMAVLVPLVVHSEGKKKVEYRKTQKVDFEGSDVDGKVRSPDGALMVEKRGVQFLPLYEVTNHAEKSIFESIEYLR